MSPVCRIFLFKKKKKNADNVFTESASDLDDMFDKTLFDAITADESIDEVYEQEQVLVDVKDKTYTLPRALTRIGHSNFMQIGKLARSRIDLEDGPLRASLLHIDAGGEIPEHTHTGFELTLLLDGEFSDEDGHYVPGDFMMLDGRHNHTPKTIEGCLCFTVVSSALHFNKGISKLLNPIGNLIY